MDMMCRIRVLAVALLLFGMNGAAWSEPFRIGVVLPLSGDMKEYGTAAVRGMEMAINDSNGLLKNVQFVFEDGKYDPTSAMRATQYVLSRGRVDTLFIWGDYPAEAIVPLAEKQNIPTFVGTITPDVVKGSHYSLRFISSADDFVAPLITYMKQYGMRKIGIVYSQDPYFLKLISAIRKRIPGEDLVAVEEVPFEETNFRPIISRMRNTSPDVVAVYLMPGAVSTFFRQARALKFAPAFFGGDTFESEAEIKGAGGAMEGAVYSDNIVLSDFRTRYVEKFGNDSQITYAANGYAFVELVANTLAAKKPPLAPSNIMEMFRGVGTISSRAAGDFSFSSINGDAAYRFPVGK